MSTHQLPKAVAAALQGHKHTQADVNGANGMAWVLSANVLHLWKYQDGPRATVHTHGLPYALPGQCHVAVVQHQVSPPVESLQVHLQLRKGQPYGGRHGHVRPCSSMKQHLVPLMSVLLEGAAAASLWHEGTLACRRQRMCP